VFDWPVIEIYKAGGEEDEQEYESDHYVVLNRAPFIRPEDKALDCAPHPAHRHGRSCGLGGFKFSVHGRRSNYLVIESSDY
jgi:hypothetical protein